MQWLIDQINQHGAWIIFGVMFAEELGVPLPVAVLLVVAGALVFSGQLTVQALIAAVLVAAASANLMWYAAGRRYGHRIVGILCRISLAPDSCARQTESTFEQWGGFALMFAKLLPGFASVAPPFAGAMRMSLARFLFYDLLGVLLLLALCAGAGYLFHDTISEVLVALSRAGTSAVILLGGLLALFIFYKWLRRMLFLRSLRMDRITVEELSALLRDEPKPLIVDVRSAAMQREGKIPGAVTLSPEHLEEELVQLPETSEVVLYCSCPNEATAAKIALTLTRKGHMRVRPLKGGVDAWMAAGFGLEAQSE